MMSDPHSSDPDEKAEAEQDAMEGAEAPIDAIKTGEEIDEPDPQARMAELETEIAALKDRLLRAMAESENIRRRAEREKEDTAKYAITKFAGDIVAVADNLRRALEAVGEDARGDNPLMDNLLAGIEGTEAELLQAFQRHGIERIEAEGKPFDPNLHEAMFEQPSDSHPPGSVTTVIQTGYTIKGRLLRPARVGVAKAPGEGAGIDTTA